MCDLVFSVKQVMGRGKEWKEMHSRRPPRDRDSLPVILCISACPNPHDLVFTCPTVPSAPPENVMCDPLSSQALRVRWNPLPLNLSNGPVQGYKVFYKRTSNIQGEGLRQRYATNNVTLVKQKHVLICIC